jgi:hypothetical protein
LRPPRIPAGKAFAASISSVPSAASAPPSPPSWNTEPGTIAASAGKVGFATAASVTVIGAEAAPAGTVSTALPSLDATVPPALVTFGDDDGGASPPPPPHAARSAANTAMHSDRVNLIMMSS